MSSSLCYPHLFSKTMSPLTIIDQTFARISYTSMLLHVPTKSVA